MNSGLTANIKKEPSNSQISLVRAPNFSTSSEPVFQNELTTIVRRQQAEISKMKRLLKLQLRVNSEDGLKEVANDIPTHPNHYQTEL